LSYSNSTHSSYPYALLFFLATMTSIRSFQSAISKPLLWKLTGFGSSIVGFSCYALSPSFLCLVKEWSPKKIVAYSVVSSLLSISMLFVKKWSLGRHGKSLLLKGHVVFVVLALTNLWSFWEDRCQQGKVENRFRKIMNLASIGAFALMALSLSRQLQIGFDAGVSNFLVGCFLVTLMKMNLKLAPLAALFCYLLVNNRSISDSLLKLRARAATQYEGEPSLQDIESGDSNGAVISHRSREILDRNLKFLWNEIRSEVWKFFLRMFKDDKDGERLPDLQGHETNSDVSERDTNEVDIQETSNVLACGTDELSSQDPDQTNSGVLEHEKDVVPLQHGEAERFSSSENDIQNTEKSIKKML